MPYLGTRPAERFAGRARPVLFLVLFSSLAVFALTETRTAQILYLEAAPVLDALRDSLPAALRGRTPAALEAAWPGWVSGRDREIRARLARGDEDSVVNLWLFGTSFTTLPPARDRDMAAAGGGLTPAQIVERRLGDVIAGMASPGANERLQFARLVVERNGIDPATAEGRERMRRYLIGLRARAIDEFKAYDREVESAGTSPGDDLAAHSSIFHDRGLSSDTSLLPAFGVDQALATLASQARLRARSVRRVALVGPGLDFTNKADGYDFYPQQTLQPFALVDSLNRLGLAAPGLRVTTFDVSPRINSHLEAAIARARSGASYQIVLPRDPRDGWRAPLVAYWQRFGATIGEPAAPAAAPGADGAALQVRAVRVRPDVVRSIVPLDLDIVVEHLAALQPGERFNLVIATNVLVYYQVFEQALALANVAAMLRPGGLFISNDAVFPAPPMDPTAGYTTVVYNDRQFDRLLWYDRR